jgi:hypothetical protein
MTSTKTHTPIPRAAQEGRFLKERPMTKYLTASVLVLGLAGPAFAATQAGNQGVADAQKALGSDCVSKIDRA